MARQLTTSPYLCQQCNCSRIIYSAGCAIDLASYTIMLLHTWANHIYARHAESTLHPVGTQNASRINYNHVTIALTPLTTTRIVREWQGPSVAPAADFTTWQCVRSCRPGDCTMTPVPLGDHDETGGCWPQYDPGFFPFRGLIQRSALGRRRVAKASRRGSQQRYNDVPARLIATVCAGQTTNYNDEIWG